MFAGAAKTDITPQTPVWMDGMLRAHPSTGVHDPLFARALVLSESAAAEHAFALVAVDVCVLDDATAGAVQRTTTARTGIPATHIVIAATHTHSGPAALGIFTPREEAYVQQLVGRMADLIAAAAGAMQPAEIGVTSGHEDTISHYRRMLARDGHVVMNWEDYRPEDIVGPLGVADPEVGVVKVLAADGPRAGQVLAVLFNHAGHPNILSGDNFLLSADYPGLAARLLEEELGGVALFFNGALGSVDIDGLRDRDWAGLERAGRALAHSVSAAAHAITPSSTSIPEANLGADRSPALRCARTTYTLPGRRITDAEWVWAQQVLARTGGQVAAVADGVGDDYKAALYRELHETGPRDLPVTQTCLALGDCALLTFPGELYTEIGQHIKAQSPFKHSFIIGLANGYVGYIPTRKAIAEGGYAEDTRRVDAAAEAIVIERSLALLHSMYTMDDKNSGNLRPSA